MSSYDYITSSGVIVPDTGAVLAEVQAEFRTALGADISVELNTPQGALITAEVSSRQSVLRNNALLANQINPNLAGGVFLDAIWALTGGSRATATRSIVPAALLTGQPSTIIPTGTLFQTAAGNSFASQSTVVISAGGTATVDCICQEVGPVPAVVATMTTIVASTAVLGLDSVTNPNAVVLGANQQSDASARLERRQELALQAASTSEAIMSRVRAVSGVKSLAFRENTTGAPVVIDTIPLVEHSIWVCVDGGTDTDVATAIITSKSGGSDYNGAEIVAYTDPFSGQTSNVQFDRPTPVPILCKVYINAGSAVADPVTATKNAILDYANGDVDGENGFQVGIDVSPFELSYAVNVANVGIFVTKIEIAYDVMGPVYATDTLAIAINEVATIIESGIQVIIT